MSWLSTYLHIAMWYGINVSIFSSTADVWYFFVVGCKSFEDLEARKIRRKILGIFNGLRIYFGDIF